MNIKEIYEKFEKLHSYSFATIDGDMPQIRIAHFLTYDDDGLYFQTMKVKPFYRQLTQTNKVAVCALVAGDGAATHDEDGLSEFPPGYAIRVSGNVREVTLEELEKKAENDNKFMPLLKDIERYPTMTTFVVHSFEGGIFDYDFEGSSRDHKLERIRFGFGGMKAVPAGFSIDEEKCIGCGLCAKVCTFKAIVEGEKYSILGNRCDECGSCYTVCPQNAVIPKTQMEEADRKQCGKVVLAYAKSQEK